MKKITIRFIVTILVVTAVLSCATEMKVRKKSDSIIEKKALTIDGNFGQAINGKSFQQEALLSHNGFQYVGFYNSDRHVCLARWQLPSGSWEILELKDYFFSSNDAHNTISLGICPTDGTLHLSFDHHNDTLNYRVSEKGVTTNPESVQWVTSLFGPVLPELEQGKKIRITYPRFWQTPEGGLQFCYRRGGSGNGDRMLVDYDPVTGKWKNTRQIDSGDGMFRDDLGESNSRCSYPNGYDYGPNGKLHATWVWREDAQGSNHDLLYAWSNDEGITWRNNSGKIFNTPPGVNAPGLKVVNIGRKYGLMNTHGQAIDNQGRLHVVMWHCSDETLEEAGSNPGEYRWGPPEARRYHHYRRDVNGTWHHVQLPWVAGDRPKIFVSKNNNLYLIHSARLSIQNNNFSAEEGDLVIAAATSENEWSDWQIIHVEKGPFVNEMLGDPQRWKEEEILSVIVQEMPGKKHQPTPLRIIDFEVK